MRMYSQVSGLHEYSKLADSKWQKIFDTITALCRKKISCIYYRWQWLWSCFFPPPMPIKVYKSVTTTLIPETNSKEGVTKNFFTPSQRWICMWPHQHSECTGVRNSCTLCRTKTHRLKFWNFLSPDREVSVMYSCHHKSSRFSFIP
jgi:hypothetical protein